MSPRDRSVDLLIVGGGPAGLATAIEARLRGLRVVVLDRRRPPLDKPCGEGLMPDGLARLKAMGVEAEGRPFHGIRYVDAGTSAEGRFPSLLSRPSDRSNTVPGLGVRRTRLHAALLERAEELGVESNWGVRVIGIDAERGVVATDAGDLCGRIVVGADGLRSKVRGWARLDSERRHELPRFGVRRHYALRPWTDLVEVHWSDRAEAYVTPVAENEVGVAILWSGAKAGFDHWTSHFPELAERLAGAEVLSKDLGTGPLRQRVRSVIRGRVALVGDAAGYVDAITGEGLSIAFHQAEALATALTDPQILERPKTDEQAILAGLRRYRRRHAEIGRLPNAMTELLLFVERYPALRRRVIRALARDPRLFRRFLAVHCRSAPAWTLGPEAPRLLWRLAMAGRA